MIQILYKKIDDSVLIAWGNAPGKPQRGDINIAYDYVYSVHPKIEENYDSDIVQEN